jgi:hypothetical protein
VVHGNIWNSFLNTLGSYKLGSTFNLGFTIASGAGGTGVDIAAGIGDSCISQLLCGGHAVGLILRGANHHITGTFETCATTALRFDQTANCILDLVVDNCAEVFDIVTDAGYHKIRASIHLVTPQVLQTGAFAGTNSIDIKDSGGIGDLLQLPGRDILAGGYTNTLPQANGTILNTSNGVANGQTGRVGLGAAAESGRQLLVKEVRPFR